MPSPTVPLPEEQPSLDLGVDVPITPVEVIQPRKRRGRGAIGRHHRWLQGQIQQRGPELVERLVKSALDGDMLAMKLCLDRGWGTPMRAAAPIDLPRTTTPMEIRQAMHEVAARMAAGELDTQTGGELIVAFRHLLASYSVQTTSGDVVVNEEIDTRDLLEKRLVAALADRRRRANGHAPEGEPIITPPPAAAVAVDDDEIPDDAELTEEQIADITARVEEAVKRKLNGY